MSEEFSEHDMDENSLVNEISFERIQPKQSNLINDKG
jgi:hypothetical protein